MEMNQTIERRNFIKLCVKLRKTATKTLKMLDEAFGDDYLKKSSVSEKERMLWMKADLDGHHLITMKKC